LDNSGFGQAPRTSDPRANEKQSSAGTVIPPSTAGHIESPSTTIAKLTLAAQIKGGASWFYWIAALSLINTLAAMTGTNWKFIIGLGMTQLVDAVAVRTGGMARIAGLIVDVFISGLFFLFGMFGSRAQSWAFIVGLALFGLDTGLEFILKDWLGLAFHGYVLYRIYGGFSRVQMLKQMNEFTQVG
jgi:hypothetical protein